MKRHHIFILALLTLVMSSCSSVRVSQDFDTSYSFAGLTTYAWNNEALNTTENLLEKDELLAKRVYAAVNTNLQLRGFKLSENPDMVLSCSYTVTSRLQTDTVQPAIGVGYGRYGRYGGFGVQSGTSVRQYDQGMLNIYLHSTADKKLIWKGTGTREVFTHSSPEKITNAVNEMVETILNQFPPSR